ncbi:hypothetical protein [Streptomyces sp. NPDC059957]|uniref:hypothetical protein n=1 Tax=unclassified Streptomyces TaxID=2593676 RepID=UPI00365DEE6C
MLGYTGTASLPHHLVVALPDGRIARSQRLTPLPAGQVAIALQEVGAGGTARTEGGETHQKVVGTLMAEVADGTNRHLVVTVVHGLP